MQKLMTKLNKARQNKKGFTLIELIVVLVILAILAAILVPTFVSYIDRARNASIQVEARDALVAVQSAATEQYAVDPGATALSSKYEDIAEDRAELKANASISDVVISNGEVASMTYENKLNDKTYTCTYEKATGWTIPKSGS